MTPKFHSLKIRAILPEAGDAARIRFEVPEALREDYRFAAGQYLTLKADVNGQSLRRSYSICCGEAEYAASGLLEVGIKRVQGGLFSNHVLDMKAGQMLEVMTPEGKFGEALRADAPTAADGGPPSGAARHLVAFAAGSGITPVMALMKTWLTADPLCHFTLVYGNRKTESVMFLEDIAALKNQYLGRLRVYHVLSRQPQEIELFNGRIDQAKLRAFTEQLMPVASMDHVFICGPDSMIDEIERGLQSAGLPRERLHLERFGVPGQVQRAPVVVDDAAPAAALTVILDGKQSAMRLPYGDARVLDVALAQGLDLPFACKGGVCCTCRAKVLEGEVVMEKNYSLEPHEVAKGFVLTCQAKAKSDRVVISFDER